MHTGFPSSFTPPAARADRRARAIRAQVRSSVRLTRATIRELRQVPWSEISTADRRRLQAVLATLAVILTRAQQAIDGA
jgi:hypothetical protein